MLCPGLSINGTPAFTVVSTPSMLTSTGSCERSSESVALYSSITRLPPPLFIISSDLFQWKCMGVSCSSPAAIIFSQYILSFLFQLPLRIVKRQSPTLLKSPLPKSVISQPRRLSHISLQVLYFPFHSSGDHAAHSGSMKWCRFMKSLNPEIILFTSLRFII